MNDCKGEWKNDCPHPHCECARLAMDSGANRDVVDGLEESCPILHPTLNIKTGEIVCVEGKRFVFGKDLKTGEIHAFNVELL